MATIGSRSAVVELPVGIRLRGTLAWLAWLGLHLYTLLGNRNRIVTLVNLSWRYLTWSRGGGIIVGDDPRRRHLDPPADPRRLGSSPCRRRQAARRARAQQKIAALGADAALITSPPNVRYLSGLVSSNAAILLPADGAARAGHRLALRRGGRAGLPGPGAGRPSG